MQSYHFVWLVSHPHRSVEWLAERLREGFDIHHLNGDHGDDDPLNLVLIEHTDHMLIHGARFLGRLSGKTRGSNKLTARAKKNIRLQKIIDAGKAQIQATSAALRERQATPTGGR